MLGLAVWIMFEKPDILHIQWIPLVQKLPFDIWFMKFARMRGVRIVYTVHNVLPHDSGQAFKDVYGRVYAQADGLICHTKETQAQLESEFRVGPQRIWVIPHGPLFHEAAPLDVNAARARLGFSKHVCIVLMQGMLKPYKGVEFLLEAWRAIHDLGLDAQLAIVGTGEKEFEERIRNQIVTLGIQDSVRLDLRYISDEELASYHQACDVIAYPYKAITASGALMTGLSYGKAIIATDLPSFQEILENGKSALLVKYGDIEALRTALTQLIQGPDERARLAAEASKISRAKFSWSAIAAKTRRCYLTVLGRGNGIT
jgi:glycosyltransferase involved in cell wall biosynthesis